MLADEMRDEQDDGLALQRTQMLEASQTHQTQDAAARRPPENAALEQAAADGAKVTFRQRAALGDRKSGKTVFQIRKADAAALAAQRIEQQAERLAQRGEKLQRQKMQQPDQKQRRTCDQGAHPALGGGSTPAGTLYRL